MNESGALPETTIGPCEQTAKDWQLQEATHQHELFWRAIQDIEEQLAEMRKGGVL